MLGFVRTRTKEGGLVALIAEVFQVRLMISRKKPDSKVIPMPTYEPEAGVEVTSVPSIQKLIIK